jgi:serpin B
MISMTKSLSLCVVGLAAALSAACSSSTEPASGTTGGTQGGGGQGGAGAGLGEARSAKAFDAKPTPAAADYAALVTGANDFGFDLYKKLGDAGNVIYSPLSTATALSMTYAGARGATAAQMKTVLHDTLGADAYAVAFNKLLVDLDGRNVALHKTDEGDKSLKLHLVDAVFAQKDYALVPAYLDTLGVHYDAGVKLLDFAADAEGSRKLINGWVADNTEQKILDLLPQGSIDGSTRLVLANALYFYGSWVHPFEKDFTKDATFHAPAGDVTASTMHATLSAPYIEGDGFKATELGYDGGAVAMTIVLPDAGKLADVEASLSSAWLAQTAKDLESHGAEVALGLPKFKFTWGTTSFTKPLEALGMTDAFQNPPADFSGMEPKKELYISDVLHKAFVGVDEYGTEAAAATAVVMNAGAVPDPPKAFDIDRPFLFLVRDTVSGAVLFVGKVVDPTK